jgi:branched-chain amino acid transport system permease protein
MNAFYVINILVYATVDAMACLGLNQQFGVAGVTNFGFIVFQAAGGYAAAILALPADTANGGFQSYIGGWNLPFPLPWIGAAVVGGLVALPFAFLFGRRLRGDFAAVGLLVTAVLLNLLVTNFRPLLNGDAGLSLIPAPLRGQNMFSVQPLSYQWGFALGALVLCAAVFAFLRRLTESPYGRSLRAMRDNDVVADSLGKNLLSMRTAMLVTGGAVAGLSGGILVSYITTWSPAAWGYAETVVLFAAVIIGGAGNQWGALLGAILVPVGFEEVTRYIPTSNSLPPNLVPSLEWVAIGLLIVGFLWFRPQGVLPERKRVIAVGAPSGDRTTGWHRWAKPRAVLPEPRGADGGDRQRNASGATTRPAPEPTAGGGEKARGDSGNSDSAKPDSAVVLEAVGVSREFGGVHAVHEVSFVVRRGTLTGLIGPNGAGKSTLLAMLAGTLPVSSGKLLYLGDDVTSVAAFRRARMGLVRTFQLASEFKRLTVMENLMSSVQRNRGDSFLGAMAVLGGGRAGGRGPGVGLAGPVRPYRPRERLCGRPVRWAAAAGGDHARAHGPAAHAAARRAHGGSAPAPGPPDRQPACRAVRGGHDHPDGRARTGHHGRVLRPGGGDGRGRGARGGNHAATPRAAGGRGGLPCRLTSPCTGCRCAPSGSPPATAATR